MYMYVALLLSLSLSLSLSLPSLPSILPFLPLLPTSLSPSFSPYLSFLSILIHPFAAVAITVDVISSSSIDSLPVASTCSQRMSIPLYPSYQLLKKKLLQAVQCQAYGLG